MEQPNSRRLLGIAAVIVGLLLVDLLPSRPVPTHLIFGDQHVFVPSSWGILSAIAIFAVGGFISRDRFVPVAAMIAALLLLVGQYTLYKIALPTGQATIAGITIGNIPSIASVFASAVVGAYVGEQVYSRKKDTTPSAFDA